MRAAKRSVGVVRVVLTLLVIPRIALAHPMGNFSINHYTKIVIGPRTLRLDYIIDMAEIPTFQETQRVGITARPNDPALAAYLREHAETLMHGLSALMDGHPLALQAVAEQAIFPPGAGGLPTMKIGFIYEVRLPAALSASPQSLHYQDDNFPGRAGWKEIIATVGQGAHMLKSSVPEQDRSLELTNYPTDMLHSPPQALQADVSFKAGVPAGTGDEAAGGALNPGWLATDGGAARSSLRLDANRQGTPRGAFTDLIKSNRFDLAFLLTAAVIAAVLGGFHALEPGHGKTLVAAYLVGSHGTARHAVMLGGIVTASHTVSVYALGIITLYASQWIMPEQLYPWLGMASGMLVAGLGFTLFIRRYLANDAHADAHHTHSKHVKAYRGPHPHPHDHHYDRQLGPQPHHHAWWGGHAHGSEGHSHAASPVHQHLHNDAAAHSHDCGDRITETPTAPSLKSLFALGVTGGIVPCPAALVVLLGALAFHRLVFGLFLILAFSAGLATVLISFGLAMVYAGRFMSRFGERGPLTERWLPLVSAAVITVVGVTLTMQSLVSAGVFRAGT